jgi:hypothetical protein
VKRWARVLAFLIIGLILGWLSGRLLTRFFPVCGDPCGANTLERILTVTLLSGGFFVLGSLIWGNSAPDRPAIHRRLILCVAVLLVVTCAFYMRELEKQNAYLYAIREIQPSSDFPAIVIAKQEVPVYHEHDSTLAEKFRIKVGDRCALGGETGEKKTPRIEIRCRQGFGAIAKDRRASFIEVD